MFKLAKFILSKKLIILGIFLIISIISIFLISKVKINYNLSDYLPKDAQSLKAIEEMAKEYPISIPNVKLLIPDVSIEQVLEYKKDIKKIKGVKDVLWADNYFDLINSDINYLPLQDWYKDNNALLQISIDTTNTLEVVNNIKKVVKNESIMAGDAVNLAVAQENIYHEIQKIMLFVVPIILVILLLTTSSWFEPLLFIITIGISIIINMGTNIIFGSISSITHSAAAILQLAVSMDYAIFLLHRFATFRHKGKMVEDAMRQSIHDSTSTILASALTTILGFLALVIMQFRIGPDLGIVLAKGVILSLISVLFLLPILVLYTYKLIDKTHHKSLLPSFNRLGKGITKIRYGVIIIVLLLIVPAFLASQNNKFLYGSTGINSEDSDIYKDTMKINEMFGLNNQMVILIPKNDFNKENELINELRDLNYVITVNSFVTTFGTNTPIQYLPKEIVGQFISKNYSRIILKTNAPEEGEETFELVKKIKTITHSYYDDYHLAGISVTNYDMKDTITKDNLLVNIVAVISILIILIIMFKSLLIPIILVLTIEAAIWINLGIAYLNGNPINYMGYLIISTVQLGATVDYAILFAKRYLEKAKKLNKLENGIMTIKETAPSILSSALILAIAGLGLGFISTNRMISELGILIGRGALISALMVLLFIPAMFIIVNKYLNNRIK